MNQGLLLAAAEKLLVVAQGYFESGEYIKPFSSKELADSVVHHAATGAVAAMATGILPGAGSIIATGIGVGAIWGMYVKICKIIGIELGKNKLKTLASAVLTNVAVQLAGMYVASFAISLIPGAGIPIVGAVNFAVIYFSGLVFLMILTNLFKVNRKDVDLIDGFEKIDWKASIKEAIAQVDKKALFNEAKNLFTEMRKDGSLEKSSEQAEIISDDVE